MKTHLHLKSALTGGFLSLFALQQMILPVVSSAAPYQANPVPRYFSVPNYANSQFYNPADRANFPGIRKFVDTLPGLDRAGANNLGQFIPVAVPDTTTYPGSDYYEIGLVEYTEKMHTDLPRTKLRGYVQLDTLKIPGNGFFLSNPDGSPINLPGGNRARGVTRPHYLGPLIAATKDRPVRILFRNLLPIGQGGDLFLPVDTTVMGSGKGPQIWDTPEPDPQNPMCGAVPKPAGCYAENRGTLHLHGGLSPWISDGTPHQWTTPSGENTAYPKGVSVKNVPDMPNPGPGAITFFYTNQQSARLMFYHDHAWGMTRLNVYAGAAAPYVISDDAEKTLVNSGTLPTATLPIVVQDKTFVPTDAQMIPTDPLWDKARWGGRGSLWAPHVYVPAQNPGDPSGVNQYGRWAYGPWFWPPTNNIDFPPVNNPYYGLNPNCNPDTQWCEPLLMPGTPFVSMGMESFHDTPVVNGTAYPTVTVEPKAYRLRVLNAANDRFFNLSLYKAVDGINRICDAALTNPTPSASGVTCTEVALNPTEVQAALTDPTVFPTPVAGTEGPSWIQFGNEGGFLPSPVVIPPQPITWVNDPTVFNAGNVDQHSLLLGPAERADVVVDFSQYAGQTLILYNDSPAAFPARDPRYDYYTGNGDYTDTGGAPPTTAGYGPNIRTVMQIKVANNPPAQAYNLAALQTAFGHQQGNTGVFESSQNPIIVGQSEYNSAYGTSFSGSTGLVQIFDEYINFDTVAGPQIRMQLTRKAIQDEMGEAFEKEYGRMSGNLGLERPNVLPGQAQNLILYPFVNPASEIVRPIGLPPGVNATPITSGDDGTQIWKITHNGVDTHPIHFHLFDVQVLNRVGWDGIIRKPDLNELGWKETVRISPLEDTIVALRPFQPKLPFGLPDSIRPLNPAAPIGNVDVFNSTNANGDPIPQISNENVNFEWEYVWHCHILSHEEMDMMRPISAQVDPELPYPPQVSFVRNGNTGPATLNWVEKTPVDYAAPDTLQTWGSLANEIGYYIYRAPVINNTVGAFTRIGSALANKTTYTDNTAQDGQAYRYRLGIYNAAGETKSANVGAGTVPVPTAPTGVTAILENGPQIRLTWNNIDGENYYLVEVSKNGGPYALIAQVPGITGTAGTVQYIDTMVSDRSKSYQYRVSAMSNGGVSAATMSDLIAATPPPDAPSNLTGTSTLPPGSNRATVNLQWSDNSNDETGFTIERATNAAFTTQVVTTPMAADAVTAPQAGLNRRVTYYFRVKANNGGGASAWSNTFTITTP